MSNAKTIEMARKMLKDGNGYAYASILSGAIRAAMSDRSANLIRSAIAEDNSSHLFLRIDSNCPLAA